MLSVKLDLLKHKEQVHERPICPKTNFTLRLNSPLKQHTFVEPWCSHQTDKIRALGETKSATVSDILLFSDIKKRKHLNFFFSNDHSFLLPSLVSLFFFLLRSFLHVVQYYVLWHNEVFDDRSRRSTKQKSCSDRNTCYVFVLWKIPLSSLSSRPAVTIHLFFSF